jgi:5'-phosphate synthase pdxT subunit
MTVGILALQGDFAKHHEVFARLGVQARDVRTISELQEVSGLVIPGGESTTLTKLISADLRAALCEFALTKPVWGTCAGMIMISKSEPDALVRPLRLLDIRVNRNGFGRQLHSFEANVDVAAALGQPELALNGIFIRAPRIEAIGADCEPFAWLEDEVVGVRAESIMASSFHPELSGDDRVHRYFVSLCR